MFRIASGFGFVLWTSGLWRLDAFAVGVEIASPIHVFIQTVTQTVFITIQTVAQTVRNMAFAIQTVESNIKNEEEY